MKAKVDSGACALSGDCAKTCPAVFELGSDSAKVKVDTVPPAEEAKCRQAAEGCPMGAISVQE